MRILTEQVHWQGRYNRLFKKDETELFLIIYWNIFEHSAGTSQKEKKHRNWFQVTFLMNSSSGLHFFILEEWLSKIWTNLHKLIKRFWERLKIKLPSMTSYLYKFNSKNFHLYSNGKFVILITTKNWWEERNLS